METERDSVTTRGHSWLTVVVVNMAHAFAHLNNQALSVLYPVLREEFGFGYTGIAVVSLTSQLAGGPVQIIYGVLTRFMRRVRIMAIGTLFAFTGNMGTAASQSFAHLIASRAIRGLGTSPNHPVGGAIMADSFPKSRSRAFGLYTTSGSIGSWVSPLLAGGMLYFMGWRWVVFTLSLPVILASLLLFSLKEPAPRTDTGEGTRGRARLGLSEYKAVLKDRNARLVVLVMMVGAGGRGAGALITYLTTILVDRYGIDVPFAAMFLAAYMFGGIVGPLSIGWFADRTSPRLALRITLALSAVFVLLIMVPGTPGIFLGVVIFLAGVFLHSRGTLTQSMLVSLGPKDARVDTLLSLYGAIGTASAPVWILLTGVIVDNFGLAPALMIMAASYILGIVILSFIKFSPTQEEPQVIV